jgi:hypothetical protein
VKNLLQIFGFLAFAQLSIAAPVISEFMAVNSSTLADENGDFSDWIEIHNPDTSAIFLAGYSLTDDSTNATKWTFPAVILAADERIIVFASNKDRIDPASELHTNFKLSSGGEYLALIAPDENTVETGFAPQFPPQYPDQSFGYGNPGDSNQVNITPLWDFATNYANVQLNGVQSGNLSGSPDSIDANLNGNQLQYYMWFDFSSVLGSIPASSTIDSATLTWSGAVSSTIFGPNAVTSNLNLFAVPDANRGIDTIAASFNDHLLVDYSAANTPVASFVAVPGQMPTTTWNIKSLIENWQDNPSAPQRGQIMIVTSAQPMFMDWDTDGAGKPTLQAAVQTTSDSGSTPLNYFDSPTPGATNSGGQIAGPIFDEVTENPPRPSGAFTVTASFVNPVTTVSTYYRLGFGSENQVSMIDNGVAPDAVAGDNIWTATIPASAVQDGEMTRWRFVAIDPDGAQTKEPAYRDTLDSHQYYGTVGIDPVLDSNLNVLHWFVQNPTAANNTTGTQGAVYYLDQFYDNVHFNRHGQSTGGFIKKSYNLDFNKTQRFQWSVDAPRVADIDLLTNWADKSKVRHPIAWEIMRESGVHAHFAFTIRVEQNGTFFSTADFVEDGDGIYLDRAGLNKNGALYKVYGNRLNKDNGDSGTTGVEKKNRKSEGNADLQALIDGLDLTGDSLEDYLYDNIDIPKTINILAANATIRNTDMHSKNWYIYRDTDKSDEWAILPWDLDLSGGRKWNSSDNYFDNALFTSGTIQTGGSIRLVSHLFNNTDTRAMFYRRVRTLVDQFIQPSSTPVAGRWFETRLDQQSALIDDPAMTKSDARRDFEKWGSWVQGSGNSVPYTTNNPAVESMSKAILRWKNEYLPGRRNEIYNNQTVGNGGEIPSPQTAANLVTETALIEAGTAAFAFSPSNGNLGLTWTGSPTDEPFDTSGWISGPTGFGYENSSGYQTLIGTNVGSQMSSNNSLYIRIPFNVTDPSTFDSLQLRMQWDDGFVAYLNGDFLFSQNAPESLTWQSAASSANHEASAASFNLYDVTDTLGSLRAGQNTLAIHGLNRSTGSSDFIIRPALFAGSSIPGSTAQPTLQFGAIEFSPDSGNQDQEFVEITNPFSIAVDLSDWKITGGINHTIHPGTVIPANGTLYLSPDVTAFRSRSTSPSGGEGRFIQGSYQGHLSSFDETLNLLDAQANLISTTTYTGNPSDAQLYLVISEVMYHPAGDGLAEFIELTNISPTITLNLSDVKFVDGVDFNFTGSAITSLAPGARVLVVRDIAAFTAVYGSGHPIAGIFANDTKLNNDGDKIKLEDALNGTIREFTYNDAAPWPLPADEGYSLVLKNPGVISDPDLSSNWRSSTLFGGNPNTSDALALPANPAGDANGNGVADLIDYGLGNDLGLAPIQPKLHFETADLGEGPQDYLILTFPISLGAEQVSHLIEEALTLASWQDAAAQTTILSQVNLGDGRALVTARFASPIGVDDRHFLRLKFQAN